MSKYQTFLRLTSGGGVIKPTTASHYSGYGLRVQGTRVIIKNHKRARDFTT